jgi:hypothetical protein
MAGIIDLITYGRLVRAARIIAGHDRVEDAAVAVHEHTSVEISARTLYAIERGEQMPSIPQYFGIALTFTPPGGSNFWDQAFSSDVQAYFRRRSDNL